MILTGEIMRNMLKISLLSVLCVVLIGCAHTSREDLGLVAGGVAGGAAGHALTGGSAIGTVGGAVGGAYLGKELTK